MLNAAFTSRYLEFIAAILDRLVSANEYPCIPTIVAQPINSSKQDLKRRDAESAEKICPRTPRPLRLCVSTFFKAPHLAPAN